MKKKKIFNIIVIFLSVVVFLCLFNYKSSLTKIDGIIINHEKQYPNAPLMSDIYNTQNLTVIYTYNNASYESNIQSSGDIEDGDEICFFIDGRGKIIQYGNIFIIWFLMGLICVYIIFSLLGFCSNQKLVL